MKSRKHLTSLPLPQGRRLEIYQYPDGRLAAEEPGTRDRIFLSPERLRQVAERHRRDAE